MPPRGGLGSGSFHGFTIPSRMNGNFWLVELKFGRKLTKIIVHEEPGTTGGNMIRPAIIMVGYGLLTGPFPGHINYQAGYTSPPLPPFIITRKRTKGGRSTGDWILNMSGNLMNG